MTQRTRRAAGSADPPQGAARPAAVESRGLVPGSPGAAAAGAAPGLLEAWPMAEDPIGHADLPVRILVAAGSEAEGARHRIHRLGAFVLSRVVASRARCHRSATQVQRDFLDHWLLCVTTRGAHELHAGGTCTTLPAGVPVVLSLGEPFEAEVRDAEWLCLLVPRDSLPELGPAFDRCRGRPLASAPGRLLGGFLQQLAAELPDMPEAEIPRAVEATRALLAAAVASGAAAGPVDEARVQATRLARVRALIRQHLPSPELTPDWLCRLAGMSRSQLYRLFEPVGGVAREIQRERLREAHRAIADPRDGRTLQAIGEELGFPDATTFSRAFRREFGYPPGTLRRSVPPAARHVPQGPLARTGAPDGRDGPTGPPPP